MPRTPCDGERTNSHFGFWFLAHGILIQFLALAPISSDDCGSRCVDRRRGIVQQAITQLHPSLPIHAGVASTAVLT